MTAQGLVDSFKNKLISLTLSELVEFVTEQNSSDGIDLELAIYVRERVAEKLNIGVENVLLVGSAKLGFSISEKKDRTKQIIKPRYRAFNDESDIDIAIIDSELFDSYWEEIFGIHCRAQSWNQSYEFQNYFFRGWIRPDKFPPSFERGVEWWKIFGDLSRDVNIRRKVRGGLYKSEFFLARYQEVCLNECLTEIRLGA
jgi:hypothetical protein